jgi:hypothetical protein
MRRIFSKRWLLGAATLATSAPSAAKAFGAGWYALSPAGETIEKE